MRIRWTDELIMSRLNEAVAHFGRMPSVAELTGTFPWGGALASRMARKEGMERWRLRVGAAAKESASTKGWKWERWFEEQAISRGLTIKPGGRVKSPFDFTVNGLTVDVKASRYAEYGHQKGWIFNIHNKERPDRLVLVCLDRGSVNAEFVAVVPMADVAVGSMVTVPSTRAGKWAPYINRWDLLTPNREAE